MRSRGKAWTLSIAVLLAGPPAASATIGFRDILPAGQGQTVNALGLASYELTGTPPPSFTNQQAMFERLLYEGPSLTSSEVLSDFKDASDGMGPGATGIQSVEHPRAGVTIERDAFNVPHVIGATRADVLFGAGYAQAEDRLFEMDLLRHLGRADLAEFLGPSYLPMDEAVWMQSDYSSAELERQFDVLGKLYGRLGQRAIGDERNYVAGINAYIAAARSDPQKLPGEYAAIHTMPATWTPADSIAIGAEINQGFDLGGGAEVADAQLLEDLRARLGSAAGGAAYADLRAADDPAAPTTTPQPFPFENPGRANPASIAMPDPGSVTPRNPVIRGSGSATTVNGARWLLGSRLARTGGDSFAFLVGAGHSRSGHPIADMGPQVDFFSPELLSEEDLQGPGIDVRGATLPGALPFPIVGHTRTFAWSVTIGVGDHIDTFAERLCNPNGSRPTRSSNHYLYHGRCIPFLVRDRHESTTPNALDSSPPESFTLRTVRSVHGPIQSTGTVAGHPVAFARADATYFHLADTGVFYDQLVSDVRSPRAFIHAVARTPFSLNWFYIDAHHIAWVQGGRYPIRARGTSADMPSWGTGRWDWLHFRPGPYTEQAMPIASLPHTVDPAQGYIANWNNKPAPRWRAADDNFYYSSAHRVQMLTRRLAPALARGRITPTRLAAMVEDIATADMRGEVVLPLALKVIGRAPRGRLARLVSILSRWAAAGAHRRDLRRRGYYDDSAAVALMDAWWPRMVRGMFEPVLGKRAYGQALTNLALDDPPNIDAEAWYNGWYGQVVQDLHDVLDRSRLPGRFSRVYCGGKPTGSGTRRSCRSVLLATLNAAADEVARAMRSGDPSAWRVPTTCPVPSSGPPPCDEIVFSALGAVGTNPIPWQNRPTFQQLVEIGG